MFSQMVFVFLIIIFLLPTTITAQTVSQDQIAFTTSDAPWMIVINSKNLGIRDQQIKPDNKSGYFLLTDEKQGFTVSLFIEPAVNCKTSIECRDFVWKSSNSAWGKVQDVVQSEIGNFYYFEFFRPTVENKPLQMLDMYAEYVDSGYWVDLHISKVQYKKEDHLLFENFVKSVKFISKNGKPATETDKSMEAARKTTEDWMLLWDSGRFPESYTELSAIAKKTFDEKVLLEHWTNNHKPLGKLKSRKLLQIQLIKSLPGVPDQSGAVLRYISSFENKENIFETFTAILEKDGSWRVATYTTNE